MKLLVFLTFFAFTFSLSAQITVSNATFPALGDTLRYSIDDAPAGIDIGAAGGPQTWDFSTLQTASTTETVYLEASSGAGFDDFPEADLYTAGQLQDHYFRKTATVFEELGYIGADQLDFGLTVASPYNPPLILRRAPMNFIDINTFETNQVWAVPIGDFADSILPQIALLDSIRFRIHTSRLDVVDGFGTCIIPGGEFEVLREKRKTETETSIDVHTFLGWTSLTDLLGGTGGLFDAIGQDTILEYHFFSDSGKEEIAVANVDPNSLEVLDVRFKTLPLITNVPDITQNHAEISTYPNPASDQVIVSCHALVPGDYQLKLFQYNGLLLKSSSFQTSGYTTLTIDVHDLTSGLYFFQVENNSGEQVLQQAVVIR